jgi:hypothetical protein
MALILEIRDRRGTTTWHSLNRPLTVGRGLSNDIILDDPYVDVRHAHILLDDVGALTVQDLGSVNGVLTNGVRAPTAILVQAGSELRIGRSTFRFRDPDEAMPPALVDVSHRGPLATRWAFTNRGSLALVAAATGLVALMTWLSTSERSAAATVIGAVMAALVLISLWAGVWAIALRGADRRFQMRGHLAVTSAAVIVTFLANALTDWSQFFFPDAVAPGLALSAVVLVTLAALIVGHLTVASVLTKRGRWRVGLGVSAAVFVAFMLIGLAQDEKFSDVPKFPAQLKPVSPGIVPTKTVDQFVKAMEKARDEADKAAKP